MSRTARSKLEDAECLTRRRNEMRVAQMLISRKNGEDDCIVDELNMDSNQEKKWSCLAFTKKEK